MQKSRENVIFKKLFIVTRTRYIYIYNMGRGIGRDGEYNLRPYHYLSNGEKSLLVTSLVLQCFNDDRDL